jgi:hypothetical protein
VLAPDPGWVHRKVQLHLDRTLRVHAMPIELGFPFGLTPGSPPHIPLPTKITIEVQDPLDWSPHLGRQHDDEIVQHCYAEMTSVLQAALTRLAKQEPHLLLARFRPFPRTYGGRARCP